MADYKKAFEILKKALGLQLYDSLILQHHNYTLLDNEYECINECLNTEPDSMDKIIEEFEKLEYECEEYGNCIEFFTCDDDDYPLNEITIYKDGKVDTNTLLKIEVLRLINRVLRLWGVEV